MRKRTAAKKTFVLQFRVPRQLYQWLNREANKAGKSVAQTASDNLHSIVDREHLEDLLQRLFDNSRPQELLDAMSSRLLISENAYAFEVRYGAHHRTFLLHDHIDNGILSIPHMNEVQLQEALTGLSGFIKILALTENKMIDRFKELTMNPTIKSES